MPYQQSTCGALTTDIDDASVIGRVLDGDIDAFELLMAKYEAMVVNRVRYHVPQEAIQETVQDVFIRAYKALSTCRDTGKFKAWLSSIAVKASYDYLRKRYRLKETAVSRLSTEQRDWLEVVSAERSKDEYERQLARKEAGQVLRWALDQLPPQDRMVLELVHLQEHSIKEAARLLGWSVVNVKVRNHRSRKKLKAIIDGLLVREKEGP